MSRASFLLEGATAVLDAGTLPGAAIAVRDGAYTYVGQSPAPDSEDLPRIDGRGMIAAPALVEMHIHGAGGIGFESVRRGEELRRVAAFLEGKGVGCFVPTILWDREAVGRLVDAVIESGLSESTIPGIHIEGPFVNPAKRGGILPDKIAAPDPGLLDSILELCRGRLRIMTVAPELPGIEEIYARLARAGVRISLGHSACTLDGARIPEGEFSVTHLFNAMSGIDHRGGGGLANLPFMGRKPWTELNSDGVHVNEACMRLAAAGLPKDRIVITSDAIAPAGLEYGECRYFEARVLSSHNGVRYVDGTLIGSNRLGIDIVASFVARTGSRLEDAVRAMGDNALAALGVQGRSGGMRAGAKADLFLWDGDMKRARRAERLVGA